MTGIFHSRWTNHSFSHAYRILIIPSWTWTDLGFGVAGSVAPQTCRWIRGERRVALAGVSLHSWVLSSDDVSPCDHIIHRSLSKTQGVAPRWSLDRMDPATTDKFLWKRWSSQFVWGCFKDGGCYNMYRSFTIHSSLVETFWSSSSCGIKEGAATNCSCFAALDLTKVKIRSKPPPNRFFVGETFGHDFA